MCEGEEEQQQNCSIFSTVTNISKTLAILLQYNCEGFLPVGVLHHWSCGYLGAAPIPYVQGVILNMTHPYLRSTAVLLDTCTDKCFT